MSRSGGPQSCRDVFCVEPRLDSHLLFASCRRERLGSNPLARLCLNGWHDASDRIGGRDSNLHLCEEIEAFVVVANYNSSELWSLALCRSSSPAAAHSHLISIHCHGFTVIYSNCSTCSREETRFHIATCNDVASCLLSQGILSQPLHGGCHQHRWWPVGRTDFQCVTCTFETGECSK